MSASSTGPASHGQNARTTHDPSVPIGVVASQSIASALPQADMAAAGGAGVAGQIGQLQEQYLESIRHFTNFGAGQLNSQESQLVNNMMLMNPYIMGLGPSVLSNTMNPKIQLKSIRNGEEPHLVNAKQYHRILKRRKQREALAKQSNRPRKRRAFLHESRHKHAMRRPRGPGGRFLRKEEIEALKQYERELLAKIDLDKADGRDPTAAIAAYDETIALRKSGKISESLLKKAGEALDRATVLVEKAEALALQQEAQEAATAASAGAEDGSGSPAEKHARLDSDEATTL